MKQLQNERDYINAIFSSIVHHYDLMNTLLSLNQDKYWRRFAISKTELDRGGIALDVCCGTGGMLPGLARSVGSQGNVVGIDFNKKMLKKAVENLPEKNLTHCIKLVQGEATNLPFGEDLYDCATISFGLRNIPNMRKTISEMKRVVKPGGKVVSLEFSTPMNPLIRQTYYQYLNYWVPLLGKIINREETYQRLSDSIMSFPHQRKIGELFKKAGLDNTLYFELTGGIATVHVGTA
ncbi:ubiquinone biosynthesis methyltransferase UbiE [candidate division MSBL1 archaeon SCGC-AAA259M10]|uniref:Demethylmenaquinone methyltransferase n=1 Tax=candidate division MSBL1 archaeon SCGC-AAA259M10 TaxID=1698270 RepID=A0A133V050_9EURY|nr:ubiquinone biosynthesis methyltransferase UbiE [candidate division MSBL1 archaeon SCGC-AAA259M10]